ncbi:hypothetical protein CDV36_012039 [Fusarium kuroshium]|uniref:AMP-dependent synthetase/ligase domain-containing protein n=1 Tax=Fusarium kuroshium TaxID=2010991 RepID=A0A3M2RST7_9HYPO|nr:hypothetical protein CDV36_012039 [Fusarium kuroshium]
MGQPANPVIWSPSEYDLTRSNLARFRDLVNKKYGLFLNTYHDIHKWSVDPATAGDFWMELFDFLEMRASKPPLRAFEQAERNMYPSPRFFPGSRFNFAGSVLQSRDASAIAMYEATEGSLETRLVTWGQLYRDVEILADAMRTHGVKAGARVAAIVEASGLAISLCLATLSIGAIWSSVSPDFGSRAILDRLVQIDPVLVFTDTSVNYNGKARNIVSTIREWAKTVSSMDSVRKIVLHGRDARTQRTLQFEQLPFDHPGFIFYSSGTTGAPKCILHSAGGVMLQIKKDYMLQIDVQPGDILFQYTTTAWIMWAFLLTAMGTGAKIVVFSGSPVYPDVNFLPSLLSKQRVSVFGTSAKYLTDLMDSNHTPREDYDLSALRRVTSTGSVLPSDVAQWFYNSGFPKTVQLISGSGGTDCACSFVTANPLTPVHANEISGKSLGMAVDVFDPLSSKPVSIRDTGKPGELVCTQPFPSQPLTFWGPKGSDKYRDAYFSTIPGVWTQGDLIRINPTTGGIQMLGRSDGVLNPSGVRFGSAEIYNVVRLFPEVEDSVCVGQRRPQDRDESVVLFLKVKTPQRATIVLKERIKHKIHENLSKRHVPKYVFYVDDIPYSNVGKKLEIIVKKIINGQKAESTVVANPDSLLIYYQYFDIETASKEEPVSELAKL